MMAADTSDWDVFLGDLRLLRRTPYRYYRECAHELAARMLALVIPRTPVGTYPNDSGKQGGTLRRGWTAKTQREAESNPGTPSQTAARAWAYSLAVRHIGDTYEVDVINPVEYASYVEYGHRQEPGRYVPALGKRLKKSWVNGQYMLTTSEAELKAIQPQVLEQVLQRWLTEVFERGQ